MKTRLRRQVFPLLLALALLALVAPGRTYGPPTGSPLANRAHPRLLVTAATLPALRAKLGSGGSWSEEFRAWVAWADRYYPSALGVSNREAHFQVVNYALIYLTHPVAGVTYGHTKAQYGDLARQALLQMPSLYSYASNYDWYGVPLAYDWIYPLLSPSDRASIVTLMKTVDTLGLTGPDRSPFNSQVATARTQKLVSALAFAGDGVDDAWANATLDGYQAFFADPTNGVTRSESDLVGEDGGAAQGISYGLYTAPHLLVAEEAWRTANGFEAAAFYSSPGRSFLRRMPQYLAYSVLPWAAPRADYPTGRRYVLAKTQRATANSGVAENSLPAFLSALTGVLKFDPNASGLAQWLRDNRAGEIPAGEVYYGRAWGLWNFVLGDKVPPVSPIDARLPLSRAFRDGRFVVRTGWDRLNDSYFSVIANRWQRASAGMSPNAPGGFTIDRNGPQVIFQSNGAHDWASESGAGPANTLVFVDRTQSAPRSTADDLGGAREYPADAGGSASFVPGSPIDLRDAMRFLPADQADQRDADYVYVDVTRSYNSTRYTDRYNPTKVSEVVRQFVYFRPERPGVDPDRLFVFDRTSTVDTRFEKRWLFHTSGEPMVNGAETVGQPVRGGTGVGKRQYSGATRVVATNTTNGSNGRVFLTPLLPASRTIVKVGGPNAAGVSWTSDSHEYEDTFGLLHPTNAPESPDTAQYVGSYRVEVIPAANALTDVFLNVVEVTNASVASPSPAQVLSSATVHGARAGDRIAVFNRTSNPIADADFTIDAAGSYGIHLSDLAIAGEYQITIGGVVTTMVASSAGTAYLKATVAAGTLVRIHATGVITQARPPMAPSNVRVVR